MVQQRPSRRVSQERLASHVNRALTVVSAVSADHVVNAANDLIVRRVRAIQLPLQTCR